MKLQTLLAVQAILFALVGLIFLLAPQPFMATYGIELDAGGVGLARLYGATVLMAAVIFWLARSTTGADTRRALVAGGFFGNGLAAVVGLINVLSGAYNATLWVSIALWLLLAAAFAYIGFVKPGAQ
jgi:hypothetical protein